MKRGVLASAGGFFGVSIGLLVIGAGSCGIAAPPGSTEESLVLRSSAFRNGDAIPSQYACDGTNISPPLTWTDPPTGTRSFALIVRDPDAPGGTFIHWVVYNIPPTKRSLAKSYTQAERAPNGTLQGLNDFERIGYGGPCPPGPHHAHRYIFTLYALDTRLPDRPGYGAGELASTMDGHVLSQAALLGTYQRLF